MKRNWLNWWGWCKNNWKIKKYSLFGIGFLNAVLLALFSFLFVETTHIRFLIFLIINIVIILFVSYKFLMVSIVFLGALFLSSFIFKNVSQTNYVEGNYIVKKKFPNSIIIEKNNKRIFIPNNNKNIKNGDLVKIPKTNLKNVKDVKNKFDRFLVSNKILNFSEKKQYIEILEQQKSIKSKIIYFFTRGPTTFTKYTSLSVFKDNSYFTKEEIKKQSSLGIIHLFSVSGLHINMIIVVIGFFMKKNLILKKLLFLFQLLLFFPMYY